jgi:hypothetical protein
MNPGYLECTHVRHHGSERPAMPGNRTKSPQSLQIGRLCKNCRPLLLLQVDALGEGAFAPTIDLRSLRLQTLDFDNQVLCLCEQTTLSAVGD